MAAAVLVADGPTGIDEARRRDQLRWGLWLDGLAHGNVRIAEVNIGEILKAQVQARLKQFNIKSTIVAKNIGYEWESLKQDFMPLILQTVKKAPF